MNFRVPLNDSMTQWLNEPYIEASFQWLPTVLRTQFFKPEISAKQRDLSGSTWTSANGSQFQTNPKWIYTSPPVKQRLWSCWHISPLGRFQLESWREGAATRPTTHRTSLNWTNVCTSWFDASDATPEKNLLLYAIWLIEHHRWIIKDDSDSFYCEFLITMNPGQRFPRLIFRTHVVALMRIFTQLVNVSLERQATRMYPTGNLKD